MDTPLSFWPKRHSRCNVCMWILHIFFPCIGHHILARSVIPIVALIAPNHVLSIIRLPTCTVDLHFVRRFHRPDHFRLCCGCCWEHFHVTDLETFHEMLPHFWLIPELRCRVNTTASCSCICNGEEATVAASCLLLNVRPCQGYRIVGGVLFQQFGGLASVRRVDYIYVSCGTQHCSHRSSDSQQGSESGQMGLWVCRWTGSHLAQTDMLTAAHLQLGARCSVMLGHDLCAYPPAIDHE